MLWRLVRIFGLFALMLAAPALAQPVDAEAAKAARELITTMKLADQFSTMLPMVFKTLKPAIVQNRPDVERDFDALLPVMQQKMTARVSELMDAVVVIYASNFSAQELHDLAAFYQTPTGQKFLQKAPVITQQTMAAGQLFGRTVAAEAQKQMMEELRNKGHTL